MLHYPELRETAIQKIWKDMRERLEDICPDIILTEPAETYIMESKEVQKTRWNGRQVRNAFQTAITLAEYEATKGTKDKDQKIKVQKRHFEEEVKLSRQFDAYMTNTLGGSGESLANALVSRRVMVKVRNAGQRTRGKIRGPHRRTTISGSRFSFPFACTNQCISSCCEVV